MNKKEFTEQVAHNGEISNTEAAAVIDTLLKGITEGLVKDGKVILPGFGSFTIQKRAARTGRNPSTGEAITIAEKNVVKFSAGKQLKETIN